MPKKGEGAAMLRDLREEERPARDDAQLPQKEVQLLPQEEQSLLEAEEQTAQEESAPPVSTEVRTPALTEGSADAREEGTTSARPQVSKAVRKSGSKAVHTDARAGSSPSAPSFLDAVDAALASRELLIGGVKATVDMSPELSTRAKRYLADHRGQNTRQVLIALFDAFLTEKGY